MSRNDSRPSGTPVGTVEADDPVLGAVLGAVRALHTASSRGGPPTAAERAALGGWSGWSGLPGLFDEAHPAYARYADARAELARLLSPAEHAAARSAGLNGHWTAPDFAAAVWDTVGDLVTRAGLPLNRVLEPSCGPGAFLSSAPPGTALTGVELDPVTARVAQLLYPHARILNESFAVTSFPDGMFDAAVGNVPFSRDVLPDPRHNPDGHALSDHFVLKAVRLTRPGGVVALLTSRATLDEPDEAARRALAGYADLVGAVRFPSHTGRQATGTDVVADLLVLRRRDAGTAPSGPGFARTVDHEVDGHPLRMNEFFADHPDSTLGRPGPRPGVGDLVVEGSGETARDLRTALGALTAPALRA